MGLLLIKECPCSDFTVQPKLKEENERKNKPNQSPSFWIYTRAAHVDISDKRHYWKNKKEELYLQAGLIPSHKTAQRLCPKQAGVRGRLESSSRGGAYKGGVGRGEVEREENQVYTAHYKALSSVYHALEKEGDDGKGNSNSLKYLLVMELFLKKNNNNLETIFLYVSIVYNAFLDKVFKFVLRFLAAPLPHFFIPFFFLLFSLRPCSFSFSSFLSLSSLLPFT